MGHRATSGGLRVLIQSYDAFAWVRAAESGVPRFRRCWYVGWCPSSLAKLVYKSNNYGLCLGMISKVLLVHLT